jgi:hypothetical protein
MARPWLSTFFENALVGPGKAAHKHPHGEVLAFRAARQDIWRGCKASGLRLVRAVDFHEHPVVNVIAKDLFDRAKAR